MGPWGMTDQDPVSGGDARDGARGWPGPARDTTGLGWPGGSAHAG